MSIPDRATREILRQLQADGRQSSQQLAEKVGLSATPCWRRVKELEEQKIIKRYTALVDREKIGLSVCVLAHVSLTRHSQGAVDAFEQAMLQSPQVMECYGITGGADYMIKVVVPDMKAYDVFLHQDVFSVQGVANIHSHVVLREIKYETGLPVPEA